MTALLERLRSRGRARNAATAALLLAITSAAAFAWSLAALADGNRDAWLGACTVAGLSTFGAVHLNGWSRGHEAAQPRTEPDPRRTR